MQQGFPSSLLPNTFRDSNEIPSARREFIQPSAPNIELMDFDTDRRQSIIRPMESDPSLSPPTDPPHQNRVTNKSLVRSNIRSNGNENERLDPEPQTNTSASNNNHHSFLGATGFDPSQGEEVDADTAYALQLQQEEYSRESLMPNRQRMFPFHVDSDDESSDANPSLFVEPDIPLFTNDEEFAAYLQGQENRNRQRYRQQPFPLHSIRQRSNAMANPHLETEEPDNDLSPVVRFPLPPSLYNEEDDDDDNGNAQINGAHAFFQLLANSGHPMPEGFSPFLRGFRPNRRTGNLQDTEEDFGPEDYERLLQLDDAVRKKKLTKHQIDSVPEIKFRHKIENTDEENKCGVCLELFNEHDALRQFPCEHVYHKKCADRWLQENNACPICRKPPVQVSSTSNSRYSRGGGGSRRTPSNRGTSNRNNNPTNSTTTHYRGTAPHRQS